MRALIWVLLGVLLLAHNDFWLWHDPHRVLGLPIGLTYHLLSCLVAAALLALAVRFAWPACEETGD